MPKRNSHFTIPKSALPQGARRMINPDTGLRMWNFNGLWFQSKRQLYGYISAAREASRPSAIAPNATDAPATGDETTVEPTEQTKGAAANE